MSFEYHLYRARDMVALFSNLVFYSCTVNTHFLCQYYMLHFAFIWSCSGEQSDYLHKFPQTNVSGSVKLVGPDWVSLASVSGSVCELEGCVWEANRGEKQCKRDQAVRIHSAPVLKEAYGFGMALIEFIFVLSGACVVLFWLACMFMMLAPRVCWPIPGNFFTSMGKWAGEVVFTQ